jgi:hypothetical protein
MANVDIVKLNEWRINEDWLSEIRAHRHTNFGPWKERIEQVDRLYRGEWAALFPDEVVEVLEPAVMNLVQVSMDDIARLVSESMPSIRVWPQDDSDKAQKEAYVSEAIAETYWETSHGQLLIPQLAMDLTGTGACFIAVDVYDQQYPTFRRIDPRMAYPDTFNGMLQDLFVTQTMKLRIAARTFPEFAHEFDIAPDVADTVEVWEYYSEGECVQAFCLIKGEKVVPNSAHIVKRWKPGCLPAAFVKLDTFDGEFRGMFDQIDGSLRTKNRIVQLLMDYTDQVTYAPMVSKGLLNDDEAPGPNAHYRLDPNVPDAQVGRLQPAGAAPQLFALLEYLESEQRGGTAYPNSRQGNVSQSIASASFVNSTQGQLTSVVRNIQRLLGSLREDLNGKSFSLDKEYLDESKPLFRSIGKKKTYKPSSDIPDRVFSKIVASATSGLDRMQGDVRVLQLLGAGLVSKETAREQIDFLPQDGEENDRIEKEMASAAMAQKFLTEAPWQVVADVMVEMQSGANLVDAVAGARKKQEEQQPELGGVPGQPLPGPEGRPAEPQSAGAENLALQKGGGTGPPPTAPEFQSPPLTNIMISGGRS